MAKFPEPGSPGREKAEATFYDTLLSPELPEDVLAEKTILFNRDKWLGSPHITNMMLVGGQVQSDQTFTVGRIRVKAWFEGDHELLWGRMFPLVEIGAVYTVMVGGKRHRQMQMFTKRLPDPQSRVLNLEFSAGPIGVPARQGMSVEVAVSPELRRTVNEFHGRKFLRVFVDGVIMRDVC